MAPASIWANSVKLTGWAPKVPLAEGLERTLAYYRDHLADYL